LPWRFFLARRPARGTWQAIRAKKAEKLAESRLIKEREAWTALDASRDEMERQERRINGDLSEALVDATELHGKVGRIAPGQGDQSEQLRLLMQRAATLAENPLANDALVRRARALQTELQQDDANRRMVARLEEISLNKADFGASQIRTVSGGTYRAYAAAFKDYGLPIFDVSIEEAARRISASPIRDALVAALDDCAGNTKEYCEKLMPIAQRASTDPWRRKYYAARTRMDRLALLQLAKEPEALEQPTQTLDALSWRIFSIDQAVAISLLTNWQRRRPADLWISHRLSEFFRNVHGKTREETLRLRDEAVGFARVALAARPNSPALHNSLAFALLDAGQLDDAIAVCRRSLDLKPDNSPAYVILGDAFRSKEDLDAAINAYRNAVALDSKSPQAHMHLGETLARKNDWDAALAAFNTAIALTPSDWWLYLSLGRVLEAKLDFAAGARAFQKAVDLRPTEARAHVGLGRCLLQIGDRNGAKAAFQRAIELGPEEAGAYASLGEALFRLRDFAGAAAAYQKAIERDPSDGSYYALGMALQSNGNLTAATTAFREALRIDYDNPLYFRAFAWACLASGDLPGYRRTCGDMVNWLDNTKETPVAVHVLRTCLTAPDALPDMARLLPLAELAAKDKTNLRLVGAVLYRAGRYEAAIQKLDEAARNSPPRAWDHLFQAMGHSRLGHADKARDYAKKALAEIQTATYEWPENEEVKYLSREAVALLRESRVNPPARKEP
jgi:tetratricopeptide (TPR) repeat protein